MTRAPAFAPAVVVASVALAARLTPVLRGGGLRGLIGYDDSVYYAAADAMTFGRIPYRDFLLLHPPGSLVLLAPFAALGRWLGDPVGLGVARCAFMLLGSASAVLVWRIATTRLSPLAGGAAGLLYALWLPASQTEGTTLLEPLVSAATLVAVALLGDGRPTRRRLRSAGAVLGLAMTMKAWAVVPFLVVALWVWRRSGLRAAGWFAGLGTAAAAAVSLPFLLAAGPVMLRMVVTDQLRRTATGVPPLARAASFLGLQVNPVHLTRTLAVETAVLAGAVVVVVALLAWRRRATRLWAGLLAAGATTLLASPSYFAHYSAFTAPALALLGGAAVDAAVVGSGRWAPVLRPLPAAAGLVGLAVLSVQVLDNPVGRPVPRSALAGQELTAARCVTADSAAALVASDVLTRDLRDGCPVIVDVAGLPYDQDAGDLAPGSTTAARRRDAEWQSAMARYLAGGDAVLLERLGADGLDRWVLSGLQHRFRVRGPATYEVLVPAA